MILRTKTISFALASILLVSPINEIIASQDTAEEKQLPTQGISHVGLTVRDLDASTKFFTELLGWRLAGKRDDYPATFVTDGKLFVALWRATDPENAVPFDRKNNIGLHHLALAVPDIETLDEIHETLKSAPGVKIEFAPELIGEGPSVHMMTYEPSGNRIEFTVRGGVSRKNKK